jgi:fructose-bisphosphate aldolase, class I
MSTLARMNRLFGADGKCFDVAIDHGIFGEVRHVAGIEDIRSAVATVVVAAPDAVQLSPGQAHFLQDMSTKCKPALVLRTDVANVYGDTLPQYLYSQIIEDAVVQAVALDAAAVVVNLLLLPAQPNFYQQCLANICRLKPACERYGMPLMIEPLVLKPNSQGAYLSDGNLPKILGVVRQAVELGADIIKADPTDDIAAYGQVIQIASGVPVLVRGGGRVSDEELVSRTGALMQQGAAGIVYGRNVIQHAHPDRMTHALMAIVHEGLDAAGALAILRGG